jgi:sulfide:quinone oxidoreductase
MSVEEPLDVVIAGGGVAAVEAALALRDLAGERVALKLMAPNAEFSYRPMTVCEPFGYEQADSYPLAQVAADVGAELIVEEFGWVDTGERLAYTTSGVAVPYDALLLAVGAHIKEAFPHVVTIDDGRMDELLHGVVQDVEEGYVKRIAFVAPARLAWPLPLYELALMTAARAYDMNVAVKLTLVTAEAAPLAVFGAQASAAVAELLADAGVETITGAYAQVDQVGEVHLQPGNRTVGADRIIALPELFGPAVRGLPASEHGFIPVDQHCRVPGVERVWAAGDAIDFAVKQGGIASQQADAAAEQIASLAGAPLTPTPFQPEIRGILLTGRKPRYLTARLSGSMSFDSQITDQPTWTPVAKISARYLAPYLEHHAIPTG